jgi:transcriptional regulator GlxA family with amidase domain
VGESPQRYVTRCRLNQAAQFLQATDVKIANISRRVGYDSQFSFSRAFKRAMGESPRIYREKKREPNN